MNENQQHRLVATFRHIDNLLGEAGHLLVAADANTTEIETDLRRLRELEPAAIRRDQPVLLSFFG